MSIIESAKAIRKRLGIKRLKSKIPVSEFEKAVVKSLREKERARVIHRIKVHA